MAEPPQGTGAADWHDLADGLMKSPASIAPKYFYDLRGSALFQEITRLPEYYPTRTEAAIMQANAKAIVQKVGHGATAIELGAGSCEKSRAWCALLRPTYYVAVDISGEFLEEAVRNLRRCFPAIDVRAVAADMTQNFQIPADVPRQKRLVLYPGSSIGNFDPPEARQLLARVRHAIDGDGALLIGIDLIKDIPVMNAAYNDRRGVTAEFNLNVLNHVNRLLGSDFDPAQWRHRAHFNAEHSRVEMHLEALDDVRVRWPGGERAFARGESIHTENSYKYRTDEFTGMLMDCGFEEFHLWTDDREWFAIVLACPKRNPVQYVH